MTTGVRAAAILLVVAVNLAGWTAHGQELCSNILRYASRDYSESLTDLRQARAIYDASCEAKSRRKSLTLQTGLNFVYQMVPSSFKAAAASAEEGMEQFCRSFSESAAFAYSASDSSSFVVRDALIATTECYRISQQGVIVTPRLQRTQLTIDISASQGSFEFRGASYDPNRLRCTMPDGHGGEQSVSVVMQVPLTNNTFSISCLRIPDSRPDGTKDYPYAEITIHTTKDSLAIPLPADSIQPVRWASDIEDRLAAQAKRIASLEARKPRLSCLDRIGGLEHVNNGDSIYDLSADLVQDGYQITAAACKVAIPGVERLSELDAAIVLEGRRAVCHLNTPAGAIMVRARLCKVVE